MEFASLSAGMLVFSSDSWSVFIRLKENVVFVLLWFCFYRWLKLCVLETVQKNVLFSFLPLKQIGLEKIQSIRVIKKLRKTKQRWRQRWFYHLFCAYNRVFSLTDCIKRSDSSSFCKLVRKLMKPQNTGPR